MMTLDNRHKLAAPYWARPNLRTVADPDGGGGGSDDDDDEDDEDDDDDDEDDDPDAGKSEAELRAEVKAARLALEEASRREVRRKKEAARLRKRNAAAKPDADGGDKPDAEAIKAEAQAAADARVAKAEARSRLRALGLDDAKLARAVKMIDLSDVLVDDDDVDGVEDAIEALKADVPELFAKPTRKRRQVSGDGDREGKAAPVKRSASQVQADKLLGRK